MKKILILLLALSLLLCSCEDMRDKKPKGARTIEGSYVCDLEDVRIAYIFRSDGYGTQLIGEEPYNINYYILGDTIVIENFSVSGGDTTTLEFYETENKVYIGGMSFTKTE